MTYRLHPASLVPLLLLGLAGMAHPAAAVPTVRLFSGTDTGAPAVQILDCVASKLRAGKDVAFVEGSSEYIASLFVTEVKGVPSRIYVVDLLLTKPRRAVRGPVDRTEARERGTDLGRWLYQQSFQGALDGGGSLCTDITQAIRQKVLEDQEGTVPIG